jgi:hypothetical protein
LDGLWSLPGNLNRKCGCETHYHVAAAYMSLKTTQFVTIKNMVIVPHPPYSLNLVLHDFALFPKLKMKLKG